MNSFLQTDLLGVSDMDCRTMDSRTRIVGQGLSDKDCRTRIVGQGLSDTDSRARIVGRGDSAGRKHAIGL